jgi:hypothetical protein
MSANGPKRDIVADISFDHSEINRSATFLLSPFHFTACVESMMRQDVCLTLHDREQK